MRAECREAASQALGRPLTDGEVALIEGHLRRSMTQAARSDTEAWRRLSPSQRVIAAAERAADALTGGRDLMASRPFDPNAPEIIDDATVQRTDDTQAQDAPEPETFRATGLFVDKWGANNRDAENDVMSQAHALKKTASWSEVVKTVDALREIVAANMMTTASIDEAEAMNIARAVTSLYANQDRPLPGDDRLYINRVEAAMGRLGRTEDGKRRPLSEYRDDPEYQRLRAILEAAEGVRAIYRLQKAGVKNLIDWDVRSEPRPNSERNLRDSPGAQNPAGFYSAVGRALETMPDRYLTMGGDAMVNWLLKQPNVRREEIYFLGLNEFFGKKPTRQAVMKQVRERELRLKRNYAEFDPERPTGDYDLPVRAFNGPRVPGRGIYFEDRFSFPRRTPAGEPFAPGMFISPHWGDTSSPNAFASIRGSIRENIDGVGRVVLGEELQADFFQGAQGRGDEWTGRRPWVDQKTYLEWKAKRGDFSETRRAAFRNFRLLQDFFGERGQNQTVLNALYPWARQVDESGPTYTRDEALALVKAEIDRAAESAGGVSHVRDALSALEQQIADKPDFFTLDAERRYENTETSFTPDAPLKDRWEDTIIKGLIVRAARIGADAVAISTSQTTARIQNNPKAAWIYDEELKVKLERQMRVLTGDQQLTVERVKLPAKKGAKPYTVWVARFPPGAAIKIAREGAPLFSRSFDDIFGPDRRRARFGGSRDAVETIMDLIPGQGEFKGETYEQALARLSAKEAEVGTPGLDPVEQRFMRRHRAWERGGDMAARPQMGLFSQLAAVLEGPKAPTKADAATWSNWLRNQPGVKAEELEWTGIDDWLKLRETERMTESAAGRPTTDGSAAPGTDARAYTPFNMRSLIGPFEDLRREHKDVQVEYAGTGTIYVSRNGVRVRVATHGKRLFETDDDFHRVRLAEFPGPGDVDARSPDVLSQVKAKLGLVADPQVSSGGSGAARQRLIARDEVADYVAGNGVRVEEVVKGRGALEPDDAAMMDELIDVENQLAALQQERLPLIDRQNKLNQLINDLRLEHQNNLNAIPQQVDAELGAPPALITEEEFVPQINAARERFQNAKAPLRAEYESAKAEIQRRTGAFDSAEERKVRNDYERKLAVHREALEQFVRTGYRNELVKRKNLLDTWRKERSALIEQRKAQLDQQLSEQLRPFELELAEVSRQRVPIENRRYSLEDRLRVLRSRAQNVEDPTQWHSYTLPGGEGYTELLLKLPNAKQFFKSSHWDEPNVLAHVRFKERAAPDGRRILAVEEFQSDWHQAGRERGYSAGPVPMIAPVGPEQVSIESREYDWLATSPDGRTVNIGKGTEETEEGARAYAARYFNNRAAEANREANIAAARNVPNAPFKNNAWAALALKRMIAYAADNGFDGVAWIPGTVKNGKQTAAPQEGWQFYDQIVPNIANDIGKKYGAKTGRVTLDGVDFHLLPMTDALRAQAETKGFPLFARAGRTGATIADIEAAGRKAFGETYDRLRDAGKVMILGGVHELPMGVRARLGIGAAKAAFDETPMQPRRALNDAIFNLPDITDDQKLVMKLRLEGKTFEEIAESMGVEPSSARQALRRAEEKLGLDLNDTEFVKTREARTIAELLQDNPKASQSQLAKLAAARGMPQMTLGIVAGHIKRWRDRGVDLRAPGALDQMSEWIAADRLTRSRGGWPAYPKASSGLDRLAGLYDPMSDRTYLFANNIRVDQVRGLILHEVGAHAGMETMLGDKRWRQVLADIDAMVDAGVPAAVEARRLAESGALKPEHVPEETLAYLVERAPELPVVRRFLAELRMWFYRTFGATFGRTLNADDLQVLAIAALRDVARRGEARPIASADVAMAASDLVPMDDLGVMSLAEDALAKTARKQGNGAAWVNELSRAGVTKEMINYVLGPEFAARTEKIGVEEVRRLVGEGKLNLKREDYKDPGMLDAAANKIKEEAVELFAQIANFTYEKGVLSVSDFFGKLSDGVYESMADAAEMQGAPKYKGFALKGGSDYRETTYSIPDGRFGKDFVDNHFPKAKGLLMHSRSQRWGIGRVVEEAQSFVHQKGSKQSYVKAEDIPKLKDKLRDDVADAMKRSQRNREALEAASQDAQVLANKRRLAGRNDVRMPEDLKKLNDDEAVAMVARLREAEQQYQRGKIELDEAQAKLARAPESIATAPESGTPLSKEWLPALVALEVHRAAKDGERGVWFTGPEIMNGNWLADPPKGSVEAYGVRVPAALAALAERYNLPLEQRKLTVSTVVGPEDDAKRARKTITVVGLNLTPAARRAILGQPALKASFAGERAETADKGALAEAKRLLKQGKSPKEVHAATGWFQNTAGKWRFEISDKQATLKKKATASVARLGDVLDHPELYRAYPHLEDMLVMPSVIGLTLDGANFVVKKAMQAVGKRPIDGPKLLGEYRPYMYLGAKIVPGGGLPIPHLAVNPNMPNDKYRSTLLHEIQHAIQDHEGGMRFASFLSTIFNRYETNHTEVEARLSQQRDAFNASQFPLDDVVVAEELLAGPQAKRQKILHEELLRIRSAQPELSFDEQYDMAKQVAEKEAPYDAEAVVDVDLRDVGDPFGIPSGALSLIRWLQSLTIGSAGVVAIADSYGKIADQIAPIADRVASGALSAARAVEIITEIMSRLTGIASIAKEPFDPLQATLAENPDLDLPDIGPAAKAVEIAKANEAQAEAMGPAIEAAAACAIKNGVEATAPRIGGAFAAVLIPLSAAGSTEFDDDIAFWTSTQEREAA